MYIFISYSYLHYTIKSSKLDHKPAFPPPVEPMKRGRQFSASLQADASSTIYAASQAAGAVRGLPPLLRDISGVR